MCSGKKIKLIKLVRSHVYFFSQRSDTNPEDAALDAERMNNFYQRALNESERLVQLPTVFLYYSCCQIVSKTFRRFYRLSLFCLIVSNENVIRQKQCSIVEYTKLIQPSSVLSSHAHSYFISCQYTIHSTQSVQRWLGVMLSSIRWLSRILIGHIFCGTIYKVVSFSESVLILKLGS